MDDRVGDGTAPSRPLRRDASLLLEASRLMQELETDLAEHDRREQLLADREAEFETRRREFDWWATRIRTELEEQRSVCLEQEAALARRMTDLDDQIRELEHGAEALDLARRSLEQSRLEVRQQAEQDLAAEAAKLEDVRASLDAECAEFQRTLTEFAEQHRAAEQRLRTKLEAERQELWTDLVQQLDGEKTAFVTERAAWQARYEIEQTELRVLRDRCNTAVAAFETQQLNRRAQCEAGLTALRDETHATLAAEQAAWCERQEQLVADWQKERALHEARLRFQQDHLDKVRMELETAQAEFRRERQLERQRLADDAEVLERRVVQLNQYRQSLDEQAKSLDRERDALAKCRKAWDSSADADRDALRADRDAWEQDRRRQELELQRQQAAIANQAEGLERKRDRLERLRHELEDTHRSTLELRLAVEEGWAQIAHAVGQDEDARTRVEQARQALVLYYQELHAGLAEQRRELIDLQTRLEEQRLVFRDERQTLMHWLTERDEQLRQDELRLREQAAEVMASEATWRQTRDQWLSEKLAAESLIRRLLAELGDRTEPLPSSLTPPRLADAA
jgi:chromosome segregation ATPase